MKKVLVTGATGFLGKYVVEELVDHGYQVRAFGRNHTIGQSLVNASVTFVQGNLTNQEDLTKACQEMDMVIHAGALDVYKRQENHLSFFSDFLSSWNI